MLIWFAETTIVAAALAGVAAIAGRSRSIGPTARHLLWLAVVIRMVTPPVAAWPWAVRWGEPAAVASVMVGREAGPASVSLESVIALESLDDRSPVDTSSLRERVERALILAWLAAGAGMAVVQARRVIRFRRRLRLAEPAPERLIDEARRVAGVLGVRMPEALVVPGIASPMLWCLGRPRLLIPPSLVDAIDDDGWRGIFAHELAHLRRRDHWVCRLEMIAGLAWWWNPLYRLARARLDAEAELACDAWVVRTLPENRLAYAEALFLVGSRSSRSGIPAPVLGAVGAGYLLERRLLMIVREHAGSRFATLASMGAVLLSLVASPSWSMAARDDERVAVAVAVDDEAKASKADAKEPGKPGAKAEAGARGTAKSGPDSTVAQIHIRIEGDDSDVTKKLEAIEKELGPGSGFEYMRYRHTGQEIKLDSKLGPGSDFEKKMKDVQVKLRDQLGPGSDFEKRMRKAGEEARAKAEAAARKAAEAAKMDLERAQDRAEWARKMKAKGYVSEATLKAEELVLKKIEAAQAKAGALKANDEAKARAEHAESSLERAQDRAERARKSRSQVPDSPAFIVGKSRTRLPDSSAVITGKSRTQVPDSSAVIVGDVFERKDPEAKAENPKGKAAAKRRLEAKIAAMEAQIRELGEAVRKLDDDDNR